MLAQQAVEYLEKALADLNLTAHLVSNVRGDADQQIDLILETGRDALHFEIKHYALVDAARAVQLTHRPGRTRSRQSRLLVISDRIVALAREELRRAEISWFDLRGHLFMTGPGLRLDTATTRFAASPPRSHPLTGRTGLATAIDILLNEPAHVAIREIARRIKAAASSVSVTVAALRDDGLVDSRGAPDLPALFAATAQAWKPAWVPVQRIPHPAGAMRNPALKLGLDDPQTPGWALTGDVAAASLGAPIGVASGAPADFYLPTASAQRLAVSILEPAATTSQPAARLALAPVPAACEHRLDASKTANEHWLIARPLFVALELAQDPARGAEILRDWTPTVGRRVW